MSPTWTYTPAEKIEGKDTVNPGTSMMSSLVYVWDHVTPRSGTSMEAVTVTGSSHLLTWEIMPIHSYDKHNVISWKELVVLVIVISVGLPTLIRLQKQNMKHFPESLGWIKTTSSNLLRLIWKDPWEIPSTVSIIINTFGSLQSRHILLCKRFRRWSDRELRRVKKRFQGSGWWVPRPCPPLLP